MNGKTQGPIDVQITAVNPNPASPGSVLELEGHIDAKSDISDLQFAWLMPEDGVAIEAGESEGQIGTLRAGDEMTLHFSVRQLSESNRQVHLHVFRMVNGEAMGRMAQYNTVDQAALESEAQMKAQKIRQRLETMDSPAQGQLHY
jgi:hypothetical protein